MPDTAPRPRITRSTKIVAVLVLLLGWTALASQWTDRDCSFIPHSYFLVISNGTPDANEGCKYDPDGPRYTDDYRS